MQLQTIQSRDSENLTNLTMSCISIQFIDKVKIISRRWEIQLISKLGLNEFAIENAKKLELISIECFQIQGVLV